MAEVTFNVTPATPRKRSYEDEEITETTAHPITNSVQRASISDHTSRDVSPAPSTTSSLTELTGTDVATPRAMKTASTGPVAKKLKLTFLEKEAQKAALQKEKEDKLRAKAEEKAKKDEEKRKANEEKEAARRVKELKKAEKQKEKDAKKQAEQEKKDAAEAAKLKKERVSYTDCLQQGQC